MSQFSPSRNRRIDHGEGAYGYENEDGSYYFNDGHGYSRYSHPDPTQCWEHRPGEARSYGPFDNSDEDYGDESEEHYDQCEGPEYEEEQEERLYIDNDTGQEDNDMDTDPPPPYSEHDYLNSPLKKTISKPQGSHAAHSGPGAAYNGLPQSTPSMQRQTARRGKMQAPHSLPGSSRNEFSQGNSAIKSSGNQPQATRRGGAAVGVIAKARPASNEQTRTGPQIPDKAEKNTTKSIISASGEQRKSPNAKTEASAKKPVRKKCSQCQVSGHDSRNCPLNKYGLGKKQARGKEELPKMTRGAPEKPAPTQEGFTKKPVKKKCSQCNVTGHDTRNCPLNQFGLGKNSKNASTYEHHHETTMTTTTTTTKTSTASKGAARRVITGRIGKPTPKRKPAAAKKV